MSKEKLSIASTDPVALDDTKVTPKEETAAAPKEEKTDDSTTKDTPHDPKAETAAQPAVPEKDEKHKAAAEEDAPAPPARPLSPVAQKKKELKDAFPTIEDKYIQAVLIASDGRMDSAFNALLFLLDPSFTPEIGQQTKAPAVPAKAALTDDELLARQLQKEFDREERRLRLAQHPRQHRQQAPHVDGDESPDEFEQLKETFTQGFEEAKTTINSWVSGISRKFNQDEAGDARQGQKESPKLFGALGGLSFNSNQSARNKKFDEDPEILALDFHKNVDVRDDEPPRLPKRTAQPELESKWQPINSDVPVNSDAFLVTDLEDEDKDKDKK